MQKRHVKQLIEDRAPEPGMFETGVKGVQLFRVVDPVRCAPTLYEPSVVAIVNGTKEAILGGKRYEYGSEYMCCPIPMPVEAGTPCASQDDPLLGVYIALDSRMMSELTIEVERAGRTGGEPTGGPTLRGLAFAPWDSAFSDALFRLLRLIDSPADTMVLGEGRLRELYYAVLKGGAGNVARRAFGLDNDIARAIEFLSSNLHGTVTIEDAAGHVGMSRAVFHRKFKQATTMSPIQYVKSMRLNYAARKIADGTNVNVAAMEVGYASSSQFSREFKRMYGQSPGQWGRAQEVPDGAI